VHDILGLILAMLNALLVLIMSCIVVWGVRYFKQGILIKTLKRTGLAAALLFLTFSADALVAADILPSNTDIDDLLGLLFMLALLYLAYGFVNDWRKLKTDIPRN
jgi:hypothetical protein